MGNHGKGSIRTTDVLLVCKHSTKLNPLFHGDAARNLLSGTLWQVGDVFCRGINPH